jgi:hypothetical protein
VANTGRVVKLNRLTTRLRAEEGPALGRKGLCRYERISLQDARQGRRSTTSRTIVPRAARPASRIWWGSDPMIGRRASRHA